MPLKSTATVLLLFFFFSKSDRPPLTPGWVSDCYETVPLGVSEPLLSSWEGLQGITLNFTKVFSLRPFLALRSLSSSWRDWRYKRFSFPISWVLVLLYFLKIMLINWINHFAAHPSFAEPSMQLETLNECFQASAWRTWQLDSKFIVYIFCPLCFCRHHFYQLFCC